MKTVLDVLVAVAMLTSFASASEPSLTLRGTGKAPASAAESNSGTSPTQVAEADTTRKVRVVLVSPYGN